MKKRIQLIAVLFISACSAISQPAYMKTFRATGTPKANILELASGNMRVGLARQSGTSLMDAQGNIIQSSNYRIDTMLALQAVQMRSDNDIHFTATYWKDTCAATGYPMMYPAFGRMDSLGNVLALHHYSLNAPECTNPSGDLQVLEDGSSVIWGKDNHLFLLKVNSIGSVHWARRFSHNGGFRFIKELPGGGLLAGMNVDTAGISIARLDQDGNIVWCKSYIRPRGFIHDCIVESEDAFVVVGYTDSIGSTNGFEPLPPDFHPKLFMMKVDGAGTVQWCRSYDAPPNLWYTRGGTRIVKAQDGNYVVLANTAQPGYSLWHRPYLMKTDQNGDTLWTRSIGATGYTYETRNLLGYSDGGFIYNGRIWGDMPDGQANWAFLYKSDSLGHLPCSEHYFPITVSDLFPTDSSFTLTSIDGAEQRPAFVTDTIYPSIVVYDGCTFTTGLPSMMDRSHTKPRIRPNPNTGRFTVQFTDPLMAESYYSVYDAMGKLLYQRPLPTGKETEEIDLSRFGAGTYVIKFTDPEGTSYERVVVE